jgi:hypothetical protein
MGNEASRHEKRWVDHGSYPSKYKSPNKGYTAKCKVEFEVDECEVAGGSCLYFDGCPFAKEIEKLQRSNNGTRQVAIESCFVKRYHNESPFHIRFTMAIPYRNALDVSEALDVSSCELEPNSSYDEPNENDGISLFSRAVASDYIALFSGLEHDPSMMLFETVVESRLDTALHDRVDPWLRLDNASNALLFYRRYRTAVMRWARQHKEYAGAVHSDSFEVYMEEPDRPELPERLVKRSEYDIFREFFNSCFLRHTNYIDMARCRASVSARLPEKQRTHATRAPAKHRVTVYVWLNYVLVYRPVDQGGNKTL